MNDDTQRELDGPETLQESSTRDLLRLMLGRLNSIEERLGHVEVALGVSEADTKPLSGRVNRLLAELVEFKRETREALATTRSVFRQELALDATNTSMRLTDLESRLRAIEERDQPQ